MKVLVLGAAGRTGRHVVAEAQRQGHDVVAFVRSAESGETLGAPYAVGDVTRRDTLTRALEGRDSVIDVVGLPGPVLFSRVTLFSESTATVIQAMQASEDARRLIVMTGMGAGDSKGHNGFLVDTLIFPLLARRIYEDKDRQEDLVRASGLDWTLVRPAMLTDASGGPVRATTDLRGVHGGKISRADVARFLVDQLGSDRWLRQSPSILYED